MAPVAGPTRRAPAGPLAVGGIRARLAAAALAAAALAGCGSAAQTSPAQSVGLRVVPVAQRGAPLELAGTTLGGGHLSLASLRGRVVVLNVWGSWCTVCATESPALVASARSLGGKPVTFVGLDVQDVRSSAQAFLARIGSHYPQLFDPSGSLWATLPDVPHAAAPSTLVLDRQGRVAAVVIGQVTAAQLRSVVAPLLA